MRIVITGATGNVGTSLVQVLSREPRVESIVAVARRPAHLGSSKVEFVSRDVATSQLSDVMSGADAVVHLAWQIQPSRELREIEATNVLGSRRVFYAARGAGVPKLIHASSVGAYSPVQNRDQLVDESWPTFGIPTSAYSRQKAQVEAILSELERIHPALAVVRMRPALIFKRAAGSEIRRYFLGPLWPRFLMRRQRLPIVPVVEGLRLQAVHSFDVAEAIRAAIVSDVRGAFNLAADPVLTPSRIAELLHGTSVTLPPRFVRALVSASYDLHLQPTDPGWLDLALRAPLMSSNRARTELGWRPRRRATEALLELLDGIGNHGELPTPPLSDKGAAFG